MTACVLDRRILLAGAGFTFLASLAPRAARAAMSGDVLIASACRFADGNHGAVLLNETGETVTRIALPGRGHDVTPHPDGRSYVAFARRPGNFAVAFHAAGQHEPAPNKAATISIDVFHLTTPHCALAGQRALDAII